MTNEIILVPHDDIDGTIPRQVSEHPIKKDTSSTDLPEKKLPNPAKETPINNWIMPPEQHGYIQANEKDCL